jgi:hypothetical protein
VFFFFSPPQFSSYRNFGKTKKRRKINQTYTRNKISKFSQFICGKIAEFRQRKKNTVVCLDVLANMVGPSCVPGRTSSTHIGGTFTFLL